MRRAIERVAIVAVLVCSLFGVANSMRAIAGTTGGVQGTVSDTSGNPLAAVNVSAAAPSFHAKTVTGSNGFYSLNGLPLDTYVLTFTKDGYQTQTLPGITTTQDQPVRVNARLETGAKSLGRVTVRSSTALVQPTVTADTYIINQQRLQDLNGTPQDLNGFQAFNSLPGVTTDNFGYPVIRGGAENDIGYQLDGVDNTDPVTGQFLNAVSLNGARSVQLSTGGYDVSSGNTNTGVINEVMKRGAYPGDGQATIRMNNPDFGHELSFDYGGATHDNRFSYYFSYGGERDASSFGDRTTILPLTLAGGSGGLSDFTTLNDEVVNLFYHFGEGEKNELQFLTNLSGQTLSYGYLIGPSVAPYAANNGNVQAGSDPFGLGPQTPSTFQSDYFTLYPGQVTPRQNIGTVDTQTFNSVIDKLNFKRQLSPSSFADVRVTRTSENLIFRYPYSTGSFTDTYQDLQTTTIGQAFDYTNQISSKHEVSFGADNAYAVNTYGVTPFSFENTYEPLLDLGCSQITNAIFSSTLSPTSSYISNGYGGCYIAPLNAALNAAVPGLNLPTDPVHAPLQTYVSDAGFSNSPVHRYDVFLKDRFQPSDRMTITFGLRWDKEVISVPSDAASLNSTYFIDDSTPGCTPKPSAGVPFVPCNVVTVPGKPLGLDVTQPSQVSPRLALSYELGARDSVRFSYGKNIEFVPTSAIENSYHVDPRLKNCDIASGCFKPLPGYGTTNFVSNLYQQVVLDLTTHYIVQYAPVRPQRAINVDFSYSHDFGHGVELRLTPYYRKGTDYVVSNSKLLFLLPSGTPVFGPSKLENAGVNENTGVEFALQRNARYGLSGLIDATYDNTFANYDSDFFPSVNNAALAANHFFHVTYVSPVVGTLNLVYHTHNGWTAETTLYYEAGYRYGVGKKTFVFDANGNPTQVLNTDLAATTVDQAYYVTDPANPGTIFQPNITASRGTPEGDDPGTLRGPQIATLNLTLSRQLTNVARGAEVGIRVENLLGNYTPTRIPSNLYYTFNGIGGYGSGSGVNPNACPGGAINGFGCEPFQYNQSVYPYENEPSGPARLYTFFVSMKY